MCLVLSVNSARDEGNHLLENLTHLSWRLVFSPCVPIQPSPLSYDVLSLIRAANVVTAFSASVRCRRVNWISRSWEGGQGGPLYRSRVSNFWTVVNTHVQQTHILSAESGFCELITLKGCLHTAQGTGKSRPLTNEYTPTNKGFQGHRIGPKKKEEIICTYTVCIHTHTYTYSTFICIYNAHYILYEWLQNQSYFHITESLC